MQHLRFKIFLSFYVIAAFVRVNAQDSASLSQTVGMPVLQFVHGNKNDIYIICGIDSSHIERMRKRHFLDFSDKGTLPVGIHYTAILWLKQNVVLLGTTHNYLYCIRNNKAMQLNKLHGLTDSCITTIDWDKVNKMIVVTTPSTRFVLLTTQNRLILKKISNTTVATETDEASKHFIKNRFRRPIQKAICNSISNVDLSGRKQKYISNHELTLIKKQLKPGDILLKRNEDQLINIGIPGIWTHAAIYIGGEKEINEYFKNIEMLGSIKPFDYIKYHYPTIAAKLKNSKHTIIEAIGEGVVINPLQHCAAVDCFVALRSKLELQALFQSLLLAFDNFSKPYDFLFDFESDDALVCSELVYKVFKPTADKQGIVFNMGNLSGKPFLSPNDIAKQFCEERNTSTPSFKLVLFYYGDSKVKKALLNDDNELCRRTLEK